MEFIYCPLCSKAVSSQANVQACPDCSHPLNVQEWKEAHDKKIAKAYGALNERLKTITSVELIDAYNQQKRHNGWTFYNENDIVQRTLENRFNFLLVAYTLLLAAYFQPDISAYSKLIILGIGFCLVGLLFVAIYRTKNRFQITLDIMHSLEPHDVGPVIHKENEKRNSGPLNKLGRKNTITGFYIPFIMMLSITIGIGYHIFLLNNVENLTAVRTLSHRVGQVTVKGHFNKTGFETAADKIKAGIDTEISNQITQYGEAVTVANYTELFGRGVMYIVVKNPVGYNSYKITGDGRTVYIALDKVDVISGILIRDLYNNRTVIDGIIVSSE